jgi:hypothetical protein
MRKIIVNAVTSERKDADYFFHQKQRKHLQTLVSNMREASFFWSALSVESIKSTLENVEKFLEKGAVQVTPADSLLLDQVLQFGKLIMNNDIFNLISSWHEMVRIVGIQIHSHPTKPLS